MATAFIMDFEGASTELYDLVMEDMQLGDTLPEGALYHVSGEADGHLYVVDVWETPEQFQAFAASQIGPFSRKHGASEPTITSFPVAQLREGTADRPVLFQVVMLPNVDAATFDRLDRIICGPEQELPEHCAYHVNGPVRGDWIVFDTWDSQPGYERFMAEQVAPAAQQVQVAQPGIRVVPVHNVLTKIAATH